MKVITNNEKRVFGAYRKMTKTANIGSTYLKSETFFLMGIPFKRTISSQRMDGAVESE